MPRHPLERLFAAFVLLWFVVVTTEPAVLHACPVHGASPADGMPAEHHTGGHSHSESAPSDDDSACTCVGDCNAGGFSVAVSSAEQRLAVIMPRGNEGPRLETELPRIVAPAFLLPYAIGPPRVRALA